MRVTLTIILLFTLFIGQVYAQSNPIDGLKEIPLSGLSTGDGYTFHIYSSDGKLHVGFSEVFITLTDQNNSFLTNFTVSDFRPLTTDLTTHSTPVGNVVKVDSVLYKTWFSFLASGIWSLSFNYTIGGDATNQSNLTVKSITGVSLVVRNYPTYSDDTSYKARWIDSFTYNNSTYYVTLAYPQSLVLGTQTVKAYINRKDSVLRPYQIVNGGFYIRQVPVMESMGHSSSGNVQFTWNATDSVYNATIHFSMEGDWRINLQVYDSGTSSLVGGSAFDYQNGESSTLYWDIFLGASTTGLKDITFNGVSVYPTLSRGDITIDTPVEANIKVIDITGKVINTFQSSGSRTISLNVQSGLYLVSVESAGKTFVQKVIVRK